jgi:predicted metal-binding membrane protein
VSVLQGPIDPIGTTADRPRTRPSLVVPVLIVAAWTAIVVAQLTGALGTVHPHPPTVGGSPAWVAVPLFLGAWLVMVVAMMLPASLPAIRAIESAVAPPARPARVRVAFVGTFIVVWLAFGLLAFTGDVGLHWSVDATQWLAARPWLIDVSLLIVAGAYQFTPLKRRSLAACRHSADRASAASITTRDVGRLGLHHGLACLGSAWALMLLMFGEGFASLPWIVALTAVMAYETTGRHGRTAASVVGAVLLLVALTVLLVSLLGGS